MSNNSDWFAARRAERLEDVRWLADTGECASGAARRLGMNFDALEKWSRKNAPNEWRRLLSREPRDHNTSAGKVIANAARWAS